MTGSAEAGGGAAAAANPFVGPRPFEAGERLWGRERELRELEDLLSAERIVLLCSPSGAGKSSLVQAGLLPRLRPFFDVWGPTRLARPPAEGAAGNRYAASAIGGFEQGLPPERRRPPAALAGLSLAEYAAGRPRRRSAPRHRLLVFDQFEEILTAEPTAVAAKEELFDQLGRLLRDPETWALFVLREDYLVPLDPYAERVPTHLKQRYRIDLLGREAAILAMAEPARAAGREFPAAARLAADLARQQVQQADGSFATRIGRHVEPVQLQVVCRRLWESLPPGRLTIEETDLEAFGDAGEALAGYYADTVAKVAGGDAARERELRDFFDRRLITAGGIRGQVVKGAGESEGVANDRIQELVGAHLVRAEARAGATFFELAHDRLIEPIRRDNAAWRRAHLSALQERAALWQEEQRPPGLLLRDAELAEAEAWAARPGIALTGTEQDFLAAARAAQAAADRERRQNARIRRLAVVASVVGLAALAASVFAFFHWRRSEAQTRKAEDLARASTASYLLGEGQTLEASLVALEVEDPANTPTAMDTLHGVLGKAVESLRLDPGAGPLKSGAASPDGRRLAAAGSDGKIRLWDAATGELLATRDGGALPIVQIAFSPDGKLLASAGEDGRALLWDGATGEPRAKLEGHGGQLSGLAFCPDGTQLATASFDRTARIWDAATGAQLAVLAGHTDWLHGVAWSPDGRQLLTASRDGSARIWDAATGAAKVLRGHQDQVYAARFSPDGRRVATASFDGTARLWDAASGQLQAVLEGHSQALTGLAFDLAGRRLATTSVDHSVRLWEIAPFLAADPGAKALVLQGHQDWVDGAAWSPDGRRLATRSRDGSARLWDTGSGAQLDLLRGHHEALTFLSWSAHGERLLTTSFDGTARLWNTADRGEALAVLRGHELEVRSVAFSPDGQSLATASRDGTARLWDVGSEAPLAVLSGHLAALQAIAFVPGSRLVTASYDGTARLWDAAGRELVLLTGHRDWVLALAVSPDRKRLATASDDGTARLWDTATGRQVALLEGHTNSVEGVAWSPDGRSVLTFSFDATARLWDASTGALQRLLTGHIGAVVAGAFSPDGRRVLTVSHDKTARLWNLEAPAGTPPVVLEGHQDVLLAGAFSPGGDTVATASADGTVRLWSVGPGEAAGRPRVLAGPGGAVRTLAFSPDGRRLAAGLVGGLAQLWDVTSGEVVSVLEGHTDSVSHIVWSPDGTRIATASRDATARLWANPENPPLYLQSLVRGRTRLCLEPELRRHALGESGAEAERRAAACGSCAPVFLESIGASDPAAAFAAYRRCLSGFKAAPAGPAVP